MAPISTNNNGLIVIKQPEKGATVVTIKQAIQLASKKQKLV